MKQYEVIREEFVPCDGNQLEDPALYVQEQYMKERSVEYLTSVQNGDPVIEARLEGGRKHRYTFCQL